MRGERQQARLLLGEHLRDRTVALLGMRALMCDGVAPAPKLRVQILDIDKRARRKEGMPEVLDLALDLPLLVGAVRRARPRGEVIVTGELEEPRVKPNRGAGALKDRAAQVIVDQRPRNARPRVEGLDVPAQKALQRLIDGEEREDGARVRQHHHEAGERAHAAADPDRAKRAPVDLGFFPGQGGEPAVERRGRRRTDQAHGAPQLDDRARVAPRFDHLEEARRAQPWILRERVPHEGQVRIELGGAAGATPHPLRIVDEGRPDGLMVDAEGGGDGADLPVLAVIQSANLGVLLGGDHGASPRTRDGSARAVEGARRFPGRRPCSATRPPAARSAPDPSTCPRTV
jgi:hypothetical protein